MFSKLSKYSFSVNNLSLRSWSMVSFAASLLVVSCHIKTGEKAPPVDPFNFSVSCLDETYEGLSHFFAGEGKDLEIRQAARCGIEVLNKFKDKVRGDATDRYSSTELRSFIENNFLNVDTSKPARKVSDEFLNQLMLIKKLLVGGNEVSVTRSEVDATISFISTLEKQMIELNPYMKIYLFKWIKPNSDPVRFIESAFKEDINIFEAANTKLQVFVDMVADQVVKNNGDYSLDNFPILAGEIDLFDSSSSGLGEKFTTYMNVIKKIKKAMAGGNENKIATSEWPAISRVVSRGYIQFLRYNYFFKDIKESNLNYQLPYIANALEDIFSALSDVLCRKNQSSMVFTSQQVADCPQQTSHITQQELYEIAYELSKVFNDFKMSEELLHELMKLKVLLIGGNTTSISVNDFNTAKDKVPVVRSFLERINLHFKMLFLQWNPKTYQADDAVAYFNRSQIEIKSALQMITDNLSGSYGMDDLKKLLKSFLDLYADSLNSEDSTEESRDSQTPDLKDGLTFAESYIELYDFILSLKKVITDNPSEKIQKHEWSQFLSRLHGLYELFSYHYYFAPEKNEGQAVLFNHYQNLLVRSIPVANNVLLNKTNKGIGYEELLEVYKAARSTSLIDIQLSEPLLKLAFHELINRLLVLPKDRLSENQNARYFQMRHYLNLYSELRANIDVLQSFYEMTKEGTVALSKPQIIEHLKKLIRGEKDAFNLELMSGNVLSDDEKNYLLRFSHVVYQQIFQLFSTTPVEINLDENGLLIMNKKPQLYTLNTLKTLNYYRLASDLIVKSYAKEITRADSLQGGALVIDELYDLIKFAGPLLSELKIYEGATPAFIDSRFLEANVFLPRSKWDAKADFFEMHDLLAHIFSGLKIHSLIKEQMESAPEFCTGRLGQVQSQNENTFSLACYSKEHRKFIVEKLSAQSNFQTFARSNNVANWQNFMSKSIVASGVFIKDPKKIKYADVFLAPHLMQYLEMIYFKYDKDSDGKISTLESREAFQAFQGIIKDLAKKELDSGSLKEKELYDLFTYILKHKRPPESFWEKVNFKFQWVDKDKTWNLQVTRQDTVEILEYIAKEIEKNKKNKIVN